MEASPQEFSATATVRLVPSTIAGVGLGAGVTSVDLYDGTSTSGIFVARVVATTVFAVPLIFKTAVHAVVGGSGKASLWVR